MTTDQQHISGTSTDNFFLKLVAEDLRQKFGNDLSRTVVVFPNKRASLFFNEYLVPREHTDKDAPIWSPRYQTISELFRSLTSLTVADPIETVCHIYDAYVQLTKSNETLDFFYGWGERLLADFDDVDKNMADAPRLFRNLKEIKELENSEFVTEEQEEVLRDFFRDFSLDNNSHIRTKFLELWNQMLPIYQHVNADLAKEGMAYEGALYRKVLEELEAGNITIDENVDRYVFVGFNVLAQVEERLFAHLMKIGKAVFYWDYDNSYAGKGTCFEAGVFLRNNLDKFPNELPSECFNNLLKNKEIEFVSSPTENAQARAVTPWIENILKNEEKEKLDLKRTAVVLCNEALLQPVLHALPSEVGTVNITKGFPLTHTPAFSFIEKEMDQLCEANFGTAQQQLDLLKEIGQKIHREALQLPQEGEALYDKVEHTLYSESYFQVYTILNRFIQLIEGNKLRVTLTTLRRLIRQVMKQASIPFHGEPAVGLQVMGVLETRNLDFDNVLMLSVNEGTLPKKANDNSFIPYNLRTEFGLTTSKHKTAVFAYYFYRLIQRAKQVRMIYNCSSEGMVKGEMSRFMTQLLIETDLPISHKALTSEQHIGNKTPKAITKPDNLVQTLSRISPSAINNYIRCQVQFYYRNVAKLNEPDPPADVIESNTFGTIFHKAAELIYKKSDENSDKGRVITKDFLQKFLAKGGNELLMQYVILAFNDCKIEYKDIVAAVVQTYLTQLIRHDIQLAPFEVVGTERHTGLDLTIPYGDDNVNVNLFGEIDRLDKVNIDGITTVRVVDYKTGGEPESAKSMEELFTPALKQPHYVLQTFLYSLTLLGEYPHPIAPALFFVHRAAKDDYTPYITFNKQKVMNFGEFADDFKEGVVNLIAEILDPSTKFVPTDIKEHCSTCPFQTLCYK